MCLTGSLPSLRRRRPKLQSQSEQNMVLFQHQAAYHGQSVVHEPELWHFLDARSTKIITHCNNSTEITLSSRLRQHNELQNICHFHNNTRRHPQTNVRQYKTPIPSPTLLTRYRSIPLTLPFRSARSFLFFFLWLAVVGGSGSARYNSSGSRGSCFTITGSVRCRFFAFRGVSCSCSSVSSRRRFLDFPGEIGSVFTITCSSASSPSSAASSRSRRFLCLREERGVSGLSAEAGVPAGLRPREPSSIEERPESPSAAAAGSGESNRMTWEPPADGVCAPGRLQRKRCQQVVSDVQGGKKLREHR